MKEFWDNSTVEEESGAMEDQVIDLGFFLAAGACLLSENMSNARAERGHSLLSRSKDPSAAQMYRKILLRSWSMFIVGDEFRWGMARMLGHAFDKNPAEARDLLKGFGYELCQTREILGNCIIRMEKHFYDQGALTLEKELFSLVEGEAKGSGHIQRFGQYVGMLFKA